MTDTEKEDLHALLLQFVRSFDEDTNAASHVRYLINTYVEQLIRVKQTEAKIEGRLETLREMLPANFIDAPSIANEIKELEAELRKEKGESEEEYNGYCRVCGTCGFPGCCGVKDFIEKHVRGKTNCDNEAVMLDEIIAELEPEDDAAAPQKAE